MLVPVCHSLRGKVIEIELSENARVEELRCPLTPPPLAPNPLLHGLIGLSVPTPQKWWALAGHQK